MKLFLAVTLLATFILSTGCSRMNKKVDGDFALRWRQTIATTQPTTQPILSIGDTQVVVRPLPQVKPKDAPRAALFIGDANHSKTLIYPGKPYDVTLVGKGGMTRLFVNGFPDGDPLGVNLAGTVKSASDGVDDLQITNKPLTDAQVLANFRKQLPHHDIVTVGHRGINRYAPENTRISYVEAVEAHTPIVEMDTALSKDGVIVLMHDPTVDRTTNAKDKSPRIPLIH